MGLQENELCREAQAIAATGVDIEEAASSLGKRTSRADLREARECCLDQLMVDHEHALLIIRAVRILNAALDLVG